MSQGTAMHTQPGNLQANMAPGMELVAKLGYHLNQIVYLHN